MTIIEKLTKLIKRLVSVSEVKNNPNSERLTFINNEEAIRKQKIKEYKVWYQGDGDELLNLYLVQKVDDFLENPIYNRNNRQYFWSLSNEVCDIKRVHSGVPNAIISTLANIIGEPKIHSEKEDFREIVEKVIKKYDLFTVFNQQQIPLTLAMGYGAFKLDVDYDHLGNKKVFMQYYDAENVDFVERRGELIGIIFKSWFKDGEKKYCLFETRRVANGNSYIEYSLNKLEGKNNLIPCELNEIDELSKLQDIEIKNYDKIMAVPSVFFYDSLNSNYGKSIFAGKLDLFDDLDMTLSVAGHTVQVSSPIEHYSSSSLQKDSDGKPIKPNIFNRKFLVDETIANGDGVIKGNNSVFITQPTLNVEQYHLQIKSLMDTIYMGLMSPATMGQGIARKDNAEAQREKEKITVLTRNAIITRQSRIIEDLIVRILDLKQWCDKGVIEQEDYNIVVQFNEFANPSYENILTTLSMAYVNNALSTEEYVERLYGNTKTVKEKEEEVARLKEMKMMGINLYEENDSGGILNEEEISEDLQV